MAERAMNCRTPANKKKALEFIAEARRANPDIGFKQMKQRLLDELNLKVDISSVSKYMKMVDKLAGAKILKKFDGGRNNRAKRMPTPDKQLTIIPFEKTGESALAAAARHLHVAMQHTSAMEVRVTRAGKVTVIQAEDYQL